MLKRVSEFLAGLSSPQKLIIKVAVDFCAVMLAALLACRLIGAGETNLQIWGPALGVVSIIAFAVVGLYKERTLFLATSLFYSVVIATACCGIASGLLTLVWDFGATWRQLLVWVFVASILVGGSRIVARDILNYRHTQVATAIAIYGAGVWGSRLSSLLATNSERRIAVIVDDNPKLHGTRVNGIKVCSYADFARCYQQWRVREIYLAMPSQKPSVRKGIILKLEELALKVQTVPGMEEILSGQTDVDQINEVSVDDLLGRDPVAPNPKLLKACIEDRAVMVTGAGGSIGSELCRQIVNLKPSVIVLYELTEFALYQIDQELRQIVAASALDTEICPVLGSAVDRPRLLAVMQRFAIDTIYHAAAYKHVPLVEHNVVSGLQNNALGTWCAAQAAIEAKVSTFVLVSTDKAVRPTNVMGATKRFAELILQGLAAQRSSHNTRFCMVRFGNVLGSSGSVVPLFRRQIAAGGPVTVTHAEITRFFMTIPEAALLVIQAGSMGQGGDVFVLDMGDEVKIVDLARRMIKLSGLELKDTNQPEGDIEIQYTGLRPGEKLYEELLIGANVLGTDHPKIMRAEEKRWPDTDLDIIVNELHDVTEARSVEGCMSLIRRAVDEYAPTSSGSVDWLQ